MRGATEKKRAKCALRAGRTAECIVAARQSRVVRGSRIPENQGMEATYEHAPILTSRRTVDRTLQALPGGALSDLGLRWHSFPRVAHGQRPDSVPRDRHGMSPVLSGTQFIHTELETIHSLVEGTRGVDSDRHRGVRRNFLRLNAAASV